MTKKVRGLLGRVTESAATTADGNAVLSEAEIVTGTFYIMKLCRGQTRYTVL